MVFESAMVGLAEVLQQTPLAVIATPPVKVITPPLVAVVYEIEDTNVVVTLGAGIAEVVKEISSP